MSNNQVALDDIGGTGVFALLAETFSARRSAAAKAAKSPASSATEAVPAPSGFTAGLRLMPAAAAPAAETPAGPSGFTTALRMMPAAEAAPAAAELTTFPSATGFTAALRLLPEAQARSADSAQMRTLPAAAVAAGEPTFSRGKVALWTGAGYVGVVGLIIGLAQLFQGTVDPVQALLVAAIGGIFATGAWRRAWSVMADDGAPSLLTTPPYAVRTDVEEAAGFAPFQAPRREDFAATLR